MADSGRVADATGLSQAEPQSTVGLGPSGFDPSRVRLCCSRDLIRVVAQRFRKYYFNAGSERWLYYDGPAWPKSPEQVGIALEALDPEVATIADVEAIMGQRSWVTEDCDLCDAQVEQWLQIGDEPDCETRWVNVCLRCAEHIAGIAQTQPRTS